MCLGWFIEFPNMLLEEACDVLLFIVYRTPFAKWGAHSAFLGGGGTQGYAVLAHFFVSCFLKKCGHTVTTSLWVPEPTFLGKKALGVHIYFCVPYVQTTANQETHSGGGTQWIMPFYGDRPPSDTPCAVWGWGSHKPETTHCGTMWTTL